MVNLLDNVVTPNVIVIVKDPMPFVQLKDVERLKNAMCLLSENERVDKSINGVMVDVLTSSSKIFQNAENVYYD